MTADNLLFLLRTKAAEAQADAAGAQRDRLAAAAEEGRDPWLTQVRAAHGWCHKPQYLAHVYNSCASSIVIVTGSCNSGMIGR